VAKGRKDTGDLYEVFRKITAKQGEIPQPEQIVQEPSAGGDAPEQPALPLDQGSASQMIPVDKRCFFITYDTAIITFIAFILVGALLYVTGFNLGKKSVTEQISFKDTADIIEQTDTEIYDLDLNNEKGPVKTEWTVEVYSVPRASLKDLEDNLRDKLEKQNYETYIARSKDNKRYLLWIGRFIKDSTTAQETLERIKNIKTRSGKQAFQNPVYVPFEESRVLK